MLAKNFRMEVKFDCDEWGNIVAYCNYMNETALYFDDKCVFPVVDWKHIIPPPQEGAEITIAIPSGTLTGFVGSQRVEERFHRVRGEVVSYFTRIVRVDSPQWDGGYNGLLYGYPPVGNWTVDMRGAIVQTSITNTQMPFEVYEAARKFADNFDRNAKYSREMWLDAFRIATRLMRQDRTKPAVSRNAFFTPDVQETSEEE